MIERFVVERYYDVWQIIDKEQCREVFRHQTSEEHANNLVDIANLGYNLGLTETRDKVTQLLRNI